MKSKKSRSVEASDAFKITFPGHAFEGLHIGQRLARKLKTHRWHVRRYAFANAPEPETFHAVLDGKDVTPDAIQKLVGKAWCARQIMWLNKQNGILLELGGNGYYLATPGVAA